MTLVPTALRRPLAALLALVLAATMLLTADPVQAVVASSVTFDLTPTDPTNDPVAEFDWSSSDGSVDGFECTLDLEPSFDCSNGFETSSSHTTGALSDGSHQFTVQPTSDMNPIGDPAMFSWTVDTAPPVLDVTSMPDDPTNEAVWGFEYTITDDSAFDVTCALNAVPASQPDFTWPCSETSAAGESAGEARRIFKIVVTDAAQNETAYEYEWTLDTTPPTATIDSAPDDPTNKTTDGFFFSADEDATFICVLEGPAPAGAADCSGGAESYSNLPEGEHTFTVTPTDTAGNEGTPASHTWTVDTSAPVATITVAPEGDVNTTDATIEFTAEEGATTECKLDTGTFASCDSPKGYTELSEGKHTFQVRATDAAGNVGISDAASWTVDTVVPETTITAKPVDPSNDNTPSFSFQADESEATFACRLDGELDDPFGPCPQDNLRAFARLVVEDVTNGSATYGPLADGEHTFEVRATDPATNVDATPASYTWTIDTVPANTFLIDTPGELTNSTSETITFDSDDDTAGFECKLDDGHYETCASPRALSELTDGEHVFTVRSVDPAGNADLDPASVTWTVDATEPDTFINSGPVAGSTVSDSSTTFQFTSDDPDATFECKLDAGAWEACTSPETFDAPDGERTFQVRAVDEAGNADSSPDSETWTVDTTGPAIRIDSGPSGRVATDDASFTFSSTEMLSNIECRVDGGAWAACTSPFAVADLADGLHTFEVQADDDEGNTGSTGRFWTVDTTAPNTELLSRPTTSTSTSASIRFRSTESPSTFECRLDDGPWAACTSPRTLTGLSVGRHDFRVRATDSVGNVDRTPAFTIWQVQEPPTEPAPDGADIYTDVDKGDTFALEIGELSRSGVTRGCNRDGTRFCPDDFVTRGQMAAFLTRALDLPAGTKVFSDTTVHPFRADIAALARRGITRGCNSAQTVFCPDDFVTRGQMAAFLTRALNLPAGTKVFSDTGNHPFRNDIAALERAGITRGCNSTRTRFCPDEPVTRGQMAAFLFRAGLLD